MAAALEMTNELLDLLPNHELASSKKVYYEKLLEDEKLINTHRLKIKREGGNGSADFTAESVSLETFKNQNGLNSSIINLKCITNLNNFYIKMPVKSIMPRIQYSYMLVIFMCAFLNLYV